MEHQKGAGKRGPAQPNPAAPARNSEIASRGDSSGMGHCHTPAQLGGDGAVPGAGGRAFEAAAARGAGARSRREIAVLNGRARSIGAWVLLGFVRVYIVFLSPFFGGACKFYPSCSNYAHEAIAKHGARRGFVLAAQRLLRCRPFTKGGFDPVPETEEYARQPELMELRPALMSEPFEAQGKLKTQPPAGRKL
jgi:putative membrane protein insertion efficiency factor